MSIETTLEQNEDSIQEDLIEIKNQLYTPGKVIYLRESSDKKYNIYRYELVQGGTKGGIKNKYVNQIGARIEGTQFTDAGGREITKDRFAAGEVVYLKVPKQESGTNQTETENIPGKVQFVRNSKDKENRDWKVYKYTFVEGGTLGGVEDKIQEQIHVWTENFYDKDGNKLPRRIFKKGETVYAKIPNTDVINPTPEMTINEIMALSDNDILQIREFETGTENINYITHSDKKGRYMVVNGKKLYSDYGNCKGSKENTPIIDVEVHESIHNVYGFAIAIKKGDKYQGVYYDGEKIYRGELVEHIYGNIYPKGYFD